MKKIFSSFVSSIDCDHFKMTCVSRLDVFVLNKEIASFPIKTRCKFLPNYCKITLIMIENLQKT